MSKEEMLRRAIEMARVRVHPRIDIDSEIEVILTIRQEFPEIPKRVAMWIIDKVKREKSAMIVEEAS